MRLKRNENKMKWSMISLKFYPREKYFFLNDFLLHLVFKSFKKNTQ